MYTQIPLSKVIESLSLCDQKSVLEKLPMTEARNINVCFEDLWNCLSDFEKKEILKENADFIASVVLDSDLNVAAWDRIASKFKQTYNRWPDDFLDEIDDCDIISYLESCGYVVGESL